MKIEEEKKIVAFMIRLYCSKKHKTAFTIKNSNSLCSECKELLCYAEERLDRCQFGDQKPSCRYCTVHCYKMVMRKNMLNVMRFSGPRMIFYSPLMTIRYLCQK